MMDAPTSSLKELAMLTSNTTWHFFIGIFHPRKSYKKYWRRIVDFPIRLLYLVVAQWILGNDVRLGTRFVFALDDYHGMGLVIHRDTVIGDQAWTHHDSTIAVALLGGSAPLIGNDLMIGANSVVIGRITIGDGAVIADGSAIRDVATGTTVAGNPPRNVGMG